MSAAGNGITDPEDYSIAGFELTMVVNPAAGPSGEYFFSARCYAPGEVSGIYGQRISSKGAPTGAVLVETAGAPGSVARRCGEVQGTR